MASRVSTSMPAPSPISTSMTGDQLGLDEMARAGVALQLRHRAEQRARQEHRIAALAVVGGAHDGAGRRPCGMRRSVGRDRRVEITGMSPSTISAPAASCGTAAMPAFSERGQAVGKVRVVGEAARRGRPAPRGCASAWWPVTTVVPAAPEAERTLGRLADQRLAVEQRHQLVGPAHAAGAAGGEHDGVDLGSGRRRRAVRAAAAASGFPSAGRRRPCRQYRSPSRRARRSAGPAPSRSRFPWGCARSPARR